MIAQPAIRLAYISSRAMSVLRPASIRSPSCTNRIGKMWHARPGEIALFQIQCSGILRCIRTLYQLITAKWNYVRDSLIPHYDGMSLVAAIRSVRSGRKRSWLPCRRACTRRRARRSGRGARRTARRLAPRGARRTRTCGAGRLCGRAIRRRNALTANKAHAQT